MRILIAILFITLTVSTDIEMKVNSEQRPKEKKIIYGNAQFNGQELETQCECVETSPEIHLAEEICEPTKIKLHQDSPGKGEGGATFEEIRHIIGPLSELIFVDPTAYHFSCLDGRIKEQILGTTGGDAGEFILALQIYEALTPSRKLDQVTIDSIFTSFLTLMKQSKFYMCTDDDALNHIEKELGITFSIDQLKQPIDQMKRDLLQILQKPENVGCLHIRNMLKAPDNYGIRPEIIKMFIKSYYKVLWDQSNPLSEKLILDNLVGKRQEKAFIEVRSNEACAKKKLAPLIAPKRKVSVESEENGNNKSFFESSKEKWISSFINHIDAVSEKRRFMAKFFSQHIHHNGEHIDIEQMHHRLNKHGLAYLELTGSKVAKYLPFYTLTLL